MYKTFSSLIFLSVLMCGALLLTAEEPKPTPVTQPRELFNGKDFSNWYKYLRGRQVGEDPKEVFTVQDGKICISGEEMGCVTTYEAFENYRLILEYRWTGKTCPPRMENTRDCGVLLHSVGEDGAWGKTWLYSIECNIIEGGTGDFIVVGDGSENFSITCPVAENGHVYDPNSTTMKTSHGGRIDWFARDPGWKDVINFRGENDLEKPLGEWNTLEIVCDGDTITNIVNGTVANVAYQVRPTCGKLQIQSEFAGIEFRRITLLPLEK